MKAAGAAAVLVTPVYYFAPSDDGLHSHYRAVAGEGGLPVVVYNSLPHVPIRPALMERLADIPGVIGVKEGMGGNLGTLGQLIDAVGDRIAVTWSQDSLLFPGFALGAVGSLGAMDSVLPGHSVETFRAVQRGDLETARKIQRGVAAVARAAYAASRVAVPRRDCGGRPGPGRRRWLWLGGRRRSLRAGRDEGRGTARGKRYKTQQIPHSAHQ